MIDRRDLIRCFVSTWIASALPFAVRAEPGAGGIPNPLVSRDAVCIEGVCGNFDVPKIVVIGVGGGGNNAIDYMIDHHVSGVDFISVNTDARTLSSGSAQKTIQLGSSGLSTVGKPDLASLAATQSEHALRYALDGVNMLFITAGMGGGTGTGAAPVIARLAKNRGILTVGVVTQPFEFEGPHRVNTANAGIAELKNHVDALIIVPNEMVLASLGEDISMTEAFDYSNDLIRAVINGFAGIVNVPGQVNIDIEDMRTILRGPGKAALGVAVASGLDRASVAAKQALNFPLMDDIDLSSATGVLVMISAAKGNLKLSEFKRVMKTIRASTSPDAHFICGTTHDESINDGMRVTVLATG
jgi:cell division protein FtsZ